MQKLYPRVVLYKLHACLYKPKDRVHEFCKWNTAHFQLFFVVLGIMNLRFTGEIFILKTQFYSFKASRDRKLGIRIRFESVCSLIAGEKRLEVIDLTAAAVVVLHTSMKAGFSK